jgi:hypothetical protein
MDKYGRARQAKDDKITWRIRFARWLPKATNTHSQHATRIAFPQQQWLHERTSMLRCTHIACLVYSETRCFVPLMQPHFVLTFTVDQK